MIENVEIRRSARAKHLHIKIDCFGKVLVVVPKRIRRLDIESLLDSNQNWISDRLSHLAEQRRVDPDADKLLPEFIDLNLTQQRYHCMYTARKHSKHIVEKNDQLVISAEDQGQVKVILNNWLQQKARLLLTPSLQMMSSHMRLPFEKLTIRGQKTRWGSCSAKHNINLNRNLLFLPRYLVEYLMVHELCHTRFLNHSNDYWRFVESFESNYKVYEKELSRAFVYVPRWAAS